MVRRRITGAFLAFLASLALLGGCAEGGPEGPTPGVIQAVGPTALLDLMAAGPISVRHRMTRRYEAHWEVDGVALDLAYRENVFSDGQGRFAVDPVQVLEPAMSTNEENVFKAVQQLRAGFFFRHRDFGVRDVGRLLKYWTVTDTGITSQVAGRTCANLDFQRQKNPSSVYHVAVDVANGLVLRVEEEDLDGNLLTLLEAESLSLTPSLTGLVFHEPLNYETEFNPSSSGLILPFVPLQPKMLPQGYRLDSAVTVLESTMNQNWVRFTYNDGLEEIFFVHSGDSASVVPGSQTAGQSGLPQDVVKYLSIGPWTVLYGEVQGESFIAMGKVSRQELVDTVDSAFH